MRVRFPQNRGPVILASTSGVHAIFLVREFTFLAKAPFWIVHSMVFFLVWSEDRNTGVLLTHSSDPAGHVARREELMDRSLGPEDFVKDVYLSLDLFSSTSHTRIRAARPML